jgi:hypothetical protein
MKVRDGLSILFQRAGRENQLNELYKDIRHSLPHCLSEQLW